MRMLLIIAITVIATFGLNAAQVAGTWKGSMDTQAGNVEVAITFQPGAALAGMVKAGEYEGRIEKGKLDGDKIYFEVNISPGKVTYEGTVTGDEMKLNVIGTQGNNYSLICTRQK
jgi:hypothetical protein